MDEMKKRLRAIVQNEALVFRENEIIIPAGNWLTDIRRVMFRPEVLDIFSSFLFKRFSLSEESHPVQIGGPEVAAIPLVTGATLRAQDRGCNATGFFIRKSRKKTGLIRMIEGALTDAPVILVDDVINRGGTLRRQVDILESLGKKVIGIFVFIRFRDLNYYEYFHKKGIRIESIFTLDEFFDNKGKVIPLQDDRELLSRVTFKSDWYFKSENSRLEEVIPKSTPVIGKEKIFFGSDQGIFWALNKNDGVVAWQYQVHRYGPRASIFSSPVLSEDKVFFGTTNGDVYALDSETGKKIWSYGEADGVYGNILSVPEDGYIIVPLQFGLWNKQGGLVALRMKDGKSLWRITFADCSRGTPLYCPKEHLVVVGTETGIVHAFNLRTKKEAWSFRAESGVNGELAYDEENKNILFTSFDGKLYAVDVATGEERWRFERDRYFYSGPVIYKEYVFVGNYDKYLYCLERSTGKRIWSYRTKSRILATPVVWNNYVFVGSNDARLHVVDVETGKLCGFFQTIERITNKVVFDSERKNLFLTTYANEIYCLSLKEESKPVENMLQ